MSRSDLRDFRCFFFFVIFLSSLLKRSMTDRNDEITDFIADVRSFRSQWQGAHTLHRNMVNISVATNDNEWKMWRVFSFDVAPHLDIVSKSTHFRRQKLEPFTYLREVFKYWHHNRFVHPASLPTMTVFKVGVTDAHHSVSLLHFWTIDKYNYNYNYSPCFPLEW